MKKFILKQDICDCCNEETKSLTYLQYLCHMNDMICGSIRYLDSKKNASLGKHVTVGLCDNCYGKVITSAINTIKKLRKNKKIKY